MHPTTPHIGTIFARVNASLTDPWVANCWPLSDDVVTTTTRQIKGKTVSIEIIFSVDLLPISIAFCVRNAPAARVILRNRQHVHYTRVTRYATLNYRRTSSTTAMSTNHRSIFRQHAIRVSVSFSRVLLRLDLAQRWLITGHSRRITHRCCLVDFRQTGASARESAVSVPSNQQQRAGSKRYAPRYESFVSVAGTVFLSVHSHISLSFSIIDLPEIVTPNTYLHRKSGERINI